MAKRRRRSGRDRPGPAGFLVVDKPAGCTSHDVVDAARRWLGIRRIGHLGTLDPQATGVLPLAVRGATKLVGFFQECGKSYVGTVRLGVTTDTLDGEGEVLTRHAGALPDEDTVREAMRAFSGEIEQIPPMFSAVKRDGVPLHRLARQGEEVERDPKKVVIHRLELLRFEPPDLDIEVDCGPGTYVRTLAHDLGQALGCGAYLAALRRIRSEPFGIEQALGFEACEEAARERRLESMLIPPDQALGWPVVRLAAPAIDRLEHGGDIAPGEHERARPGDRFSGVDADGRFVAALELRADRRLWPLRVLPGR
jgi:tRNA pseudouridine55 synthase